MKRLIFIIILLFTASAALADVILYLYPTVIAEKSGLRLSSIAMIDCGSGERDAASSIVIPSEMYRDGFIDRRELLAFVKDRFSSQVSVFGSAVKINFLHKKNEPAQYRGIARGKMVKVLYTLGAIRIEVRGRALGGGMPGEVISVKVNNRVVRAVILDGERVRKQI